MPPNRSRHSRNPSAQNPPNSVYAVDGQDWFLKDGVNWQSSFDTWNLANPPPPPPPTSAPGASGGGGTAGGGGGGMSDPSMFMFTSNAGNDNGQSPATAAAAAGVFENFNLDSLGDFSGNLGDFDLTGLD